MPMFAQLGPQDLQAVFDCLRSALSHDPATQKAAEAALRELETRPGFCSCLAVRTWQRCGAAPCQAGICLAHQPQTHQDSVRMGAGQLS